MYKYKMYFSHKREISQGRLHMILVWYKVFLLANIVLTSDLNPININ